MALWHGVDFSSTWPRIPRHSCRTIHQGDELDGHLGTKTCLCCTRPRMINRSVPDKTHARQPTSPHTSLRSSRARARLRRASHVSHEKWAHPPPWASSPGRLRALRTSAGCPCGDTGTRNNCLPGPPRWKVWYLFETEPIETLRKRQNVILRNLNVSFQGVQETSTEIFTFRFKESRRQVIPRDCR